ncbi:NitT/TauT family transport system substrate-binding protein [Natranaerovirga pectinivora]|uniref:Thiamine pyrimidine synthase n=1 Tax=Natranaerovirga pectinivora TaxID=682400 RepID=A0A4R3MLB1_9FIRM|nr:ABC transporter substrate-binding protein [Natranaerovirga pectinivora]TCT15486.1 NitT/TauT family transport system substrate-binding protein [Natranaerovirga pectinivora]
MKRKSLMSILLVLMLVAIMATGCSSSPATSGDGKKLDKVVLQLKWLPQSQFMGYYVAMEKGYYEDEGIQIEILPGGSDIIPEQQVYNGVADVGVTWVSSLMKYQSEGWELLHVGQIFQKSAMLLVSKASSGIESPSDLVGKKVGSWFGGNEYEIFALLEANGINRNTDLELVQQDFTMNQILNGTIDAASAMTYNEYGLLLAAGLDASEINVLDMNDEGVAMLQDCLFVNSDWIKNNEDLFVRFLRASIKGWADAVADPEAAGQIVYNVDQSVSLEHQVYMAKEVAKLVVPEGFDPAQIGYIDMDAVVQTAEHSYTYGLLTSPAVISEETITSKYWEEAVK